MCLSSARKFLYEQEAESESEFEQKGAKGVKSAGTAGTAGIGCEFSDAEFAQKVTKS